MNILNTSNNYNQVAFRSRNCPVKPFTIQTKLDKLGVEELSKMDESKAAQFTLDVSVEAFKDWAGSYSKSEKEYFIQALKNMHRHALSKPDGNTTILIAKDSKNEIRALFSMHSFDEFRNENVIDLKTGHLDECLIDSKYRSQGIGKIMLDSLLQTAKGHFSDIFGEANNKALNFYLREGFQKLDISNSHAKKLSNLVMAERSDANSITLITKSIDSTNSWLERVARNIK